MKIINRIFDLRGIPVLAAAFAGLFFAEGRRRLRKSGQPHLKRAIMNSIVSIPAFTVLRFLFLPIMIKVAEKNKQLQSGLNYRYHAHPLIKGIIAFLIMDYANYLWHVLNHKSTFLWRFHVVHHSDPTLDVSTAIRFHFGELIGSVFFRGAFVFLSGTTPLGVLLLYEILFEGATEFHHSNWKLPYRLEKMLNKIVVTPRMHGIHHSMIQKETDSNYSVIFSFWDRLHNTIRLNINQDLITIGIPSYSNPDELTIGYLFKLPFTRIRPWYQTNGEKEARASLPYKGMLAK